MASIRDMVSDAIDDLYDDGIERFTSQDVYYEIKNIHGKDHVPARKSLSAMLATLVKEGKIYRLKETRQSTQGARPFVLYTTSMKVQAEDSGIDCAPKPEPVKEEPTLDYRQIGMSIVANIQYLQQRVKELEKFLLEKDDNLRELNDVIQEQNKKITAQNERIEVLGKRPNPANNGSFKLSEIARIK